MVSSTKKQLQVAKSTYSRENWSSGEVREVGETSEGLLISTEYEGKKQFLEGKRRAAQAFGRRRVWVSQCGGTISGYDLWWLGVLKLESVRILPLGNNQRKETHSGILSTSELKLGGEYKAIQYRLISLTKPTHRCLRNLTLLEVCFGTTVLHTCELTPSSANFAMQI